MLKNINSNTYLSFDGSPVDGQKVVCKHDPHGWTVTAEGLNVYTLANTESIIPSLRTDSHSRFHVVDNASCVDLADHGNANNGTPVHLWSGSGNQNQKWEAQEVV